MKKFRLKEGGVQAIIQRWQEIDGDALLMEFVGYVLSRDMPVGQKEMTRKNIVAWLERELRETVEKEAEDDV